MHLIKQIEEMEKQWAKTALRRELDRIENDVRRTFLTNPHNTYKGTPEQYIKEYNLDGKAWAKICRHFKIVLPYPF